MGLSRRQWHSKENNGVNGGRSARAPANTLRGQPQREGQFLHGLHARQREGDLIKNRRDKGFMVEDSMGECAGILDTPGFFQPSGQFRDGAVAMFAEQTRGKQTGFGELSEIHIGGDGIQVSSRCSVFTTACSAGSNQSVSRIIFAPRVSNLRSRKTFSEAAVVVFPALLDGSTMGLSA
jgi:hypothetical protein